MYEHELFLKQERKARPYLRAQNIPGKSTPYTPFQVHDFGRFEPATLQLAKINKRDANVDFYSFNEENQLRSAGEINAFLAIDEVGTEYKMFQGLSIDRIDKNKVYIARINLENPSKLDLYIGEEKKESILLSEANPFGRLTCLEYVANDSLMSKLEMEKRILDNHRKTFTRKTSNSIIHLFDSIGEDDDIKEVIITGFFRK